MAIFAEKNDENDQNWNRKKDLHRLFQVIESM